MKLPKLLAAALLLRRPRTAVFLLPRGLFVLALLGFAALSPVYASFHLWQIDEVYSDASGTVQFVELTVNQDGENFLSGHTLASTAHTFAFGSNVGAQTANRHILLATPGYIALSGVPAADFNLGVNNFFDVTGDTLSYAAGLNTLTFGAGQLPLDGVNSLNRVFNPPTATTFTVAAKSPANFAGDGAPAVPSAPKVVIAGAKRITTTKSKIRVKGKAAGVVTKVAYRVGNKGPNKPVKGTSVWSFIAALKKGGNVISVIARGPGGASEPAKITITRK